MKEGHPKNLRSCELPVRASRTIEPGYSVQSGAKSNIYDRATLFKSYSRIFSIHSANPLHIFPRKYVLTIALAAVVIIPHAHN